MYIDNGNKNHSFASQKRGFKPYPFKGQGQQDLFYSRHAHQCKEKESQFVSCFISLTQ